MFPFSLGGIGGKILLAAGIAAAAGGALLYVQMLRADLARETAANAQLSAANKQNVAAFSALKAQTARDEAALSVMATQDSTLASAGTAAEQAIAAAPQADGGTVAPVLASALAAVAKMQGAAP